VSTCARAESRWQCREQVRKLRAEVKHAERAGAQVQSASGSADVAKGNDALPVLV